LLDGMRTEEALPSRLTITPPDERRQMGGELVIVQRLSEGSVSWEVVLHERTPDGGFRGRRETKPVALPPGTTYSYGLCCPVDSLVEGPRMIDSFDVMAARDHVWSVSVFVWPAK